MFGMQLNSKLTFYYAVMTFAFLLPLSRAAISFFIVLLPILWVLDGDFKRKYEQIKSNKVLLSLGTFLIFSFISFFWSENIKEALNILRLDAYLINIFVISTMIKKEQVGTIITFFLTGMFISEMIAYGVFFEIWSFKHATVQNPSPFMFWIEYSVFMAFTSILLLNRIFSRNYSKKEKLFFIVFFMTVTGNLFLATGRTGQVALIGGIFVLSVIHFRWTFKSILLSIMLTSSIFIVAYNFSDTFKIRSEQAIEDVRNMTRMDFNSSWGIRAAYWITTFDIVKEDPLFGIGLGDFVDKTREVLTNPKYSFLDKETKKFMGRFHPHNQYLLVLLQMGLIGLSLFIYMIYQILKLKIDNPEIKELSILFVTIFFISCFAEPLLLKEFTIGLFILFVGLFSIESSFVESNG